MADRIESRRGFPERSVRDGEPELGAFIVDGRGIVLGFDPDIEAMTGWLAVQIVGRHKDLGGAQVRTERGDPLFAVGPLFEGSVPVPVDSQDCELRLRCRDGRTIDVDATATRLSGSGDRVVVTVRRVLARSEIPHGAVSSESRDPLTGLPDGASFAAGLAKGFRAASAAGRPVALILADVDHMRRINDQFGRDAGDEVLRKLAGIFRAAAREEDLLARPGEDEFALALIESGRREARELAGRLRATVERFRFLGVRPGAGVARVCLSIGSASFPADAESASDLMERARDALSEARVHGRNRVWCYTRRARVPVKTPVYFDGAEPLLLGIARDLSPSGIFVQTPAPLATGMRCALAFPLPGWDGNVHVIGRVVRAVQPRPADGLPAGPPPGMAIEFERFGPEDRSAIEGFLHSSDTLDLRTDRIEVNF